MTKSKSKLPLRDFNQMNRNEISAADTDDWIVVLPLGATEQHGPHLPFETDRLIAEGIVDRLKKKLPKSSKVSFLPVEPVGYSPEHLDFKGSRSLKFDEAINRWIGIGADLSSLGIRKLVLLNAHGGNSPLMVIVATELRVRFDMLCVATSWTRFADAPGLLGDEASAIDIHGGEVETSVMLALFPELVDMKKAKKYTSNQSKFEKRFKHLRAYGRHIFGWKMQDLNPKGVVGNAKQASSELGERLIENAVNGLLGLLTDTKKFDLKLFDHQIKK